MLEGIQKLIALLDRSGQRQMLALLFLSLLSAALELAGVTSTVPFMALATNPSLLHGSGRLHDFYQKVGSPDLQTFLTGLGLLILAALTASNLIAALMMTLGNRFSHRQQKRLSLRLFQSFLSQDYAWHISHHHISLGHNLGQARTLVESNFQPLLILLSRIFSVALLVLTLIYFHPLLTIVSLGSLVVVYGAVYLYCRRRLLRAARREWHLTMEMGRTASEPLGGIKPIKLAAVETSYLALYAAQLDELAQLQKTKVVSVEVPRLLMHTLTYGTLLGLVIYLVSRYGGGSEVVGQAALYVLAGYRLLPGVQQIFSSLAWLDSGRAAVDELYQHLIVEPAPLTPPLDPLPVAHSIALEGIDFGYGESLLFHNLNLTIPRHACIGLVGTTGRGKTTLVNLLVGLLRPAAGHLRVDGQPLDAVGLRRYGRSLGYVPQDVYLSDDTILNNIGLGDAEVDEEAALAAARAAQVDEFVLALPDGYLSKIGERGIRLSGGQRQRVGIARALYRNPEVLVLDEATSALDGETEAQVMKSIQSLAHSKTIIIVAHRLTTVVACDLIYVIGTGGIVAQGTYRDLAESCAEFQALAGTSP